MSCKECEAHNTCIDAFMSHAVHCNAYDKKEVRLIDANALKEKWLFRGEDGKPYRDEIDNAPTINPTVDKDYLIRLIQEAVYDGEACARLMDMVEPKQGKWIDMKTMDEWYSHVYRCSICGCETMHYNFCPNCGAKMTTEESSTVESIVSNTDPNNAKYSSDCPWG